MATAWTKNGRVVLRRPANHDSQTGADFAIENALPIGAAPLKIVSQEDLGVGHVSGEVSSLKGRQL